MKAFKKLIAILLAAVMMMSAASVSGFAVEEKNMLDHIRIYQNFDGDYYVKGIYYPGVSYDAKVNLYEVAEGDEKILLKEFSEEEVICFCHQEGISLPDLSAEKNYCFEVIESGYDENENVVYETKYYDFTCEELNAETPAFICFDFVADENQTIDMSKNILIPVGFEGEIKFEALSYSEYFDETVLYIEPEYTSIDGLELTALNDGSLYLCLYANGEYVGTGMLEILEAEPDSFGEKMFDAYEDFTEVLSDMVNNSIFLGFFGGAWILILLAAPFALIATMIFGV